MEFAGRKLTISTGEFAGQASGSCTVTYGETTVLATATISKTLREGIDYFPLMVDYEEMLYAAGKIKGSRFIKREGRPSDDVILVGRKIDRTIRPLFPKELKNDVQVVLKVLSWDGENSPDVPALIGAAAALHMSEIPWNGPVAGAHVGKIDGNLIVNPTYEQRATSPLDVLVACNGEKVIMLETEAHEATEDDVYAAITYGQEELQGVMKLIEQVRADVGKEKIEIASSLDEETVEQRKLVAEKVTALIAGKASSVYASQDKVKTKEATRLLNEEVNEALKADNDVTKEGRAYGLGLIDDALIEACRELVMKDNKRIDGRGIDEVRPLSASVGLLPRVHGSGLFNRGETQVLSVVTLAGPGAEQIIDGLEDEYKKRYMHHYNFPGFSVGEVQPNRGAGRREIGHGALAEKAIEPMLPSKEEFPYTIRVVSEVLSSNGSTSQASVCGSSLSLFDAGVPMKKPVAGIAMGLMTGKENPETDYKILTDIAGTEDHAGDMDFKVAGTSDGITAIQMDTKIDGLTLSMCKTTLENAKKARLHILEVMNKAIAQPNELSPNAPRVISIKIDPSKIGDVIGTGGKIINEIIDATGVDIDIDDDGTVMITGNDAAKSQEAKEWVERLTKDVEVGEIYEGPVVRILDFGAFVELFPGKDGMVHISELAQGRTEKVEDVVKVGDVVKVKVIKIDDQGRVNLSIKQTDPNYDPTKDVQQNFGERKPFRKGNDRSGGKRPFHKR